MRIVVTHAVASNTGDAAILYGLRRILAGTFGADTEFLVLDQSADTVSRLYPEIRFEPLHLAPAGSTGPRGRLRRILDRLRLLLFRRLPLERLLPAGLRENLRAYRDADLVCCTGGTYLTENYNLFYRFHHIRLAFHAGHRPLLFTQSLGPFSARANRREARELLGNADVVMLRDHRSRDHLREVGVEVPKECVVPDAAFALCDPAVLRTSAPAIGSAPRIAVSVREWRHFADASSVEGMNRYKTAIRDLVIHLVEAQGAEIHFISTCQGIPDYWTDDSAVARSIVEELPEPVRRVVTVNGDFHTPDALLTELRTFDAVVSTRMHMAILSLISGVPTLAIAYEFKTSELYGRLGVPDWCAGIDSANGAELVARMTTMLDQVPERWPEVRDRLLEMHDAALASFETCREAGRPVLRTSSLQA